MGELVHLRLDQKLLKKLDGAVNSGYYSNRTEFIRESVRKALLEFERQNALRRIGTQRGSLKGAVLHEQLDDRTKARFFEEFLLEKKKRQSKQ